MSTDFLTPPTPELTPAQAKAQFIMTLPAAGWNGLFKTLDDGLAFWDSSDEDITAVLAAIGTRGKALFDLNSRVVAFLVGEATAAGNEARVAQVQALVAKIRAHTVHEDGTVTLDPAPEP